MGNKKNLIPAQHFWIGSAEGATPLFQYALQEPADLDAASARLV